MEYFIKKNIKNTEIVFKSLDKFINLYNFENKLKKIKELKNVSFYKYKEYCLYKYENKYLIQFKNGSSVSYIKHENNNKIQNNFIIKTLNKKKINNNLFEPKFEYSKIKKYEIIIFNYNNYLIEFIKIKNKIKNNITFQITIKINKDFNYKNMDDILYLINELDLF